MHNRKYSIYSIKVLINICIMRMTTTCFTVSVNLSEINRQVRSLRSHSNQTEAGEAMIDTFARHRPYPLTLGKAWQPERRHNTIYQWRNMMTEAAYEMMTQIESDYKVSTGLADRKDYSIFYGPLCKSKLVLVDQNPGGTPVAGGYKIVNVMKGQHELIEGRSSGQTTEYQAALLMRLLGTHNPEDLRHIQKINRYFRRGTGADKISGMREAAPYVKRILAYIEPELMLFGGAGKDGKEISDFAAALGGRFQLDPQSVVNGPNGTHQALYFCTGMLTVPELRPIRVVGTYHPSKWHQTFHDLAFDRIKAEYDKVAA